MFEAKYMGICLIRGFMVEDSARRHHRPVWIGRLTRKSHFAAAFSVKGKGREFVLYFIATHYSPNSAMERPFWKGADGRPVYMMRNVICEEVLGPDRRKRLMAEAMALAGKIKSGPPADEMRKCQAELRSVSIHLSRPKVRFAMPKDASSMFPAEEAQALAARAGMCLRLWMAGDEQIVIHSADTGDENPMRRDDVCYVQALASYIGCLREASAKEKRFPASF